MAEAAEVDGENPAPGAGLTEAAPEAPEPGAAAWAWSDNVPGIGEPPDWFKGDKYKSVSDQAKAYNELYSTYREKVGAFHGAPEDYNQEAFVPEALREAGVAFDEDHPLVKVGLPLLKEANASQELAQGLVQALVQADYDAGVEAGEARKAQMETVFGSLSDAEQAVGDARQWINANLGDDHAAVLVGELDMMSPAAVAALRQVIAKTRPGSQDHGNAMTAPPVGVTIEEVERMQFQELDAQGNRRFDTDPEFRERVRALRARVVGTEPYEEVYGKR